ncbi:MAG: phenylacetate--CoA ligase [Desulfobacterales bacterium]|jgi:phenylacetate-CoA ligase|nr:phenylacetate--CoA ligase [Desulfobacterales bacterium]
MQFWDQNNECMHRDEIEQVQLERLQATLNRVQKNVRYFKKIFREIDFMAEDLSSLDDLKKLPFTTRKDLRDNYPYDMFAVPLREIVRLHAPARSIDKPVVMGFTVNDLNNWGQLMARCLSAVGVSKEDIVQVSLVPGKMIGPFGVQLGTELIGSSVIPMSVGKDLNQLKIMRDFRTTSLVTTPSFALGLVHTMDSMGIDPIDFSLKHGILGSEPWSESSRKKIESELNISATDIYGLAEVFGPGVAWECPEKKGLHIAEDHFIPEIIDPVTLETLPPGTMGELVITTLTKEAFPLIRFRTGDITSINYEPCACGRTCSRISRIFKRCDDIIVIKGNIVIPDQIGKILDRFDSDKPSYQIVVEQENDKDIITVLVEISDKIFFDEIKKSQRFLEEVQGDIFEYLGWEPKIKLVEPGTFDSTEIVIDKRNFDD